jgi:hypothetical protein
MALPSGWCCAAAQQVRHECVGALPAKSDCCCGETEAASSAPAPTETPPPGKVCCCQNNPLALSESEQSLEIASAFGVTTNIDLLSPLRRHEAIAAGRSDFISPPKRLLYCVWRC